MEDKMRLPSGSYFGSAMVNISKCSGQSGIIMLQNPIHSGIVLALNRITLLNLSDALIRQDVFFCGKTEGVFKESATIENRVVSCPGSSNTRGIVKILYSSRASVDSGRYLISRQLPAYSSTVIDLNPMGVDNFLLPGANSTLVFKISDNSESASISVLFAWDEAPIGSYNL